MFILMEQDVQMCKIALKYKPMQCKLLLDCLLSTHLTVMNDLLRQVLAGVCCESRLVMHALLLLGMVYHNHTCKLQMPLQGVVHCNQSV